MTNESKIWDKLFKTIIEENSYYENIKNEMEQNETFALGNLVDDYIENANFISVYYYLDSIEDWLNKHKGERKTVFDALDDLWTTGNWKE